MQSSVKWKEERKTALTIRKRMKSLTEKSIEKLKKQKRNEYQKTVSKSKKMKENIIVAIHTKRLKLQLEQQVNSILAGICRYTKKNIDIKDKPKGRTDNRKKSSGYRRISLMKTGKKIRVQKWNGNQRGVIRSRCIILKITLIVNRFITIQHISIQF